MIYGWSPGIGDPTIMGWVTVAAYLIGSALAARAGITAEKCRAEREKLFWWLTAAILLVLAINKELDLQSLLTAVGKHLAQADGWYDNRRTAQLAFIIGIALAGLAGGLLMLKLTTRSDAATRIGLLGLVVIGSFVLIRAASFHHIDHWLGTGPAGMRWNWILEIGGIAIVALAAAAYGKRKKRRR